MIPLDRAERTELVTELRKHGHAEVHLVASRCRLGHSYRLSAGLRVRVSGIRTLRGLSVVSLEIDHSEAPMLLAKQHGLFAPPQYTASPLRAIGDEPEAVSAEWLDKFSAEARMHKHQATELALARRRRHELAQRLERAEEDARLRGVDISSPTRVIERQLAKIERRLYESAA